MASFYRYSVHQDFTSNPDSFSIQPHNVFRINLRYSHFLQFVDPEELEIEDVMNSRTFVLPRERILSDQEGPTFIETILCFAVSSSDLLETIALDIFRFVWEMERNPMNTDQRVLAIVINFTVVTPYDNREEAVVPKFRPCSKEYIEKYLKKVRFQDLEQSAKQLQCMVCLEEFDDHLGITRLPCGHVYHEKCIVKWLETSTTCPLCRYEMPMEDNL